MIEHLENNLDIDVSVSTVRNFIYSFLSRMIYKKKKKKRIKKNRERRNEKRKKIAVWRKKKSGGKE